MTSEKELKYTLNVMRSDGRGGIVLLDDEDEKVIHNWLVQKYRKVKAAEVPMKEVTVDEMRNGGTEE